MSYEVLEKQIRALPEQAQQEVAHYVGCLSALYGNSDGSISDFRSEASRDGDAPP